MSTEDLGYTREDAPLKDGPENPATPEAPQDFGPQMTLADVRRVYVGRGYERFEAAFAKCDAAGKTEHTFSIIPFFFSFFWFFYRKMYLEGFIILVVSVAMSYLADALLHSGYHAIMAGVGTAVAINAKSLYWRAVDKKIAKAMEMYPSEPQKAIDWLNAKGGVNYWAVAAGVIFLGLVLLYVAGAEQPAPIPEPAPVSETMSM